MAKGTKGNHRDLGRPLLTGALLVSSIYVFGKLTEELIDRFQAGDRDADHGYDGNAIKELRRKGLPRSVSSALERLGKATSTKTLGPAATISALALASKHPRAALFMLAGTLGTVAAQRLTKEIVRRPRPEERRGRPTTPSFPSGHSALTSSLALTTTLIAHHEFPGCQRAVEAVALPLAVLVGASRPLIRQHYPSDVVAGDVLGTACVLGAYLWYGSVNAEDGYQVRRVQFPTSRSRQQAVSRCP